MKIAMGISSLGGGGAERVISIMANYWAGKGRDVTVITLASEEKDVYHLDERVRRAAFDLEKKSQGARDALKNNLQRILYLRKTLRASRPDVVIGFSEHMCVMMLLATLGLSIPVIAFEHTDPRQAPLDRFWGFLRRWSYFRAKGIVLLTEELKGVAAQSWPEKLLHVIPNPAVVVEKNKDAPPPFELPARFIVAMGRLVPLKGFDMLLEAFSRCERDDWSLVILGEGEDRLRLEHLVKKFNLEQRALLPGRVAEPSLILRRADIFVLSSRYEGFPMALVEAMACGVAVLSFDCPTGPSDIVRDGEDGILVPPEDISALTEAMTGLMDDERQRHRLAARAPEVMRRFCVEKVMDQWDALLASVR